MVSSFIESWNDVSILASDQTKSPTHKVVSDASGHWGCGAYYKQEWFQLPWSGSAVAHASILVKELIPLVAAVGVWGKRWTGSSVLCKCDNQSLVSVIMSRTSRDKPIMHLLRCLFFLEASFDCHLVASYIPGAVN